VSTRRVRLPGADELFRATGGASVTARMPAGVEPADDGEASADRGAPPPQLARPLRRRERRPSGRERHEEKITVYCSPEELVDLEQARLTLRSRHGVAVDRGRIVREAIAMTLADLDANGPDSQLVRRLGGR
jgi:hypothetical protein